MSPDIEPPSPSHSAPAPEPKPGRRAGKSSLAWFLWLTTVTGLLLLLYQGQRRHRVLQASLQKMSQTLEQVDGTFVTIDGSAAEERLDELNRRIEALKSGLDSHQQVMADATRRQEQANAEQSDVQSQPGPGTNTLGAPMDIAEKVIGLASGEWEAGNRELAITYLVNGIQSSPREMPLLEHYTQLVVESEDPLLLEGARGLLGEILYVVAPENIPRVTQLLTEVSSPIDPSIDEPIQEAEIDIGLAIAELEKIPLAGLAQDPEGLAEQLGTLSLMREILAGQDEPPPALIDRVERHFESVHACVLATELEHVIESRFANLETCHKALLEGDNPSNRAAAFSALQSVEIAVNQIWTIPLKKLPQELRISLMAFPERLRGQGDRVQNVAEKALISQAQVIWENRPDQSAPLIQRRIEGCETALSEISPVLEPIRGAKRKQEARALMREIAQAVARFRREQLFAYQQWATNLIDNARLRYVNAGKGIKLAEDEDALAAFDMGLARIDQSLLEPGVALFFSSVMNQIKTELTDDPKEVAKIEKEMALPGIPRKKLEDL